MYACELRAGRAFYGCCWHIFIRLRTACVRRLLNKNTKRQNDPANAIMTWDCFGISPVDIKCPFCIKSSVLADADDRRLYLTKEITT